ncbi:MAG TPA: hypothetical protein VGG10_12425 [Rhizomicrobium sp.]|jgi:hypothetical protein
MTQQTSLYVPADAAGMVALSREWLGARVVFVVGFVLAFAFVGWWSYAHRVVTDQFGNVVSAAGSADDQMNDAVASGKTTKEGFAFCRLVIALGENYGVVPGTMRFAGGPGKTDVQGRYVCTGDDDANVRYAFTADHVCQDLNNAQCASLVSIVKADGTSLFKRADQNGGDAAASAPAPAPATTEAPPAPPPPASTDSAPPTNGAPPDTGSAPTDAGGGTPPQ